MIGSRSDKPPKGYMMNHYTKMIKDIERLNIANWGLVLAKAQIFPHVVLSLLSFLCQISECNQAGTMWGS